MSTEDLAKSRFRNCQVFLCSYAKRPSPYRRRRAVCSIVRTMCWNRYVVYSKRGVERYRSPVSGSRATMVFPAFSGLRASSSAAWNDAPDEIPTSRPSFCANRREAAKASSFVTRTMLSTYSLRKFWGTKPAPIP